MRAPSAFAADGLLFDLDGTLVDSIPDIAGAANDTLIKLGLPTRDIRDLRKWVGNGAGRLIKRALTGEVDGEPETDLFEQALTTFFDLYARQAFIKSRFYPDVMETLKYFHAQGHLMACVTNKPTRHTAALLEQSGLQPLFHCVVAGDTLEKQKPDPLPLIYACESMELAPDNCIMIGDSINDIRAGKSAGMPVIGLTYGYNQGINLEETEVDLLVDNFADLKHWIRRAG